jgi:threonine/homoserine/homoserine lactone efflux protein
MIVPLIIVYVGIAVVCAILTMDEAQRRRRRWGVMRILGLMLCIVWPALLIVVGLTHLWRARKAIER